MSSAPTPLEQPLAVDTGSRRLTIGLPAAAAPYESRFPLTPEGAAMLIERGIDIYMEAGAAAGIHFPDDTYTRHGVRIVTRREALGCDIVLHLPAVTPAEAAMLRPGAVLLTLLHPAEQTAGGIAALTRRHIIAIALDLIADADGHRPIADLLSEVDGRAAMAVASSLLADSSHGKGILLGGVAGVVPCEVTVIGSGIGARAAARSAIGLGAMVRMFDNDVYRLRSALRDLGQAAVVGSSLHPRVLAGALRSADVVVATTTRYPLQIGIDMVAEMKRGVIAFDLASCGRGCVFPTLRCIDLGSARAADVAPGAQVRACFVNAGSAVPRTAAMALSTSLLTLFDDILIREGVANALRFDTGLRGAVYTFLGKVVNPDIAAVAGVNAMDINLFLQFS